MNKLIHFLRLVRWPNLFFILLAESLFHFFIYKPLYPNLALTADYPFYFIVATSICIAAAGYIINDYFDVNIDQVNKPKSVVVGAHISSCLLYTSPSPRDRQKSRMPSSA